MNTNPKTILSMAIAILAVTAVVTTSALAENQKKTKKTASHSVAATAAAEVGGMPESVSSTTGQHDRKAGPAWRTIGGTVKQIKDNTYTVEDYEGNQVQLVVGQDTKHLRQKRVGDTVRAEITRGGFANSIQ
ncbi:MAG: hypothetical protein OEV17_01820 [Nitrospira sp.]|nr:hypothetical protein [Nitrospira sp.]